MTIPHAAGHTADASPAPGDWIEVDSVGEGSPRRGVILEVLGSGGHTHFRVRWNEQHVSLFYPAEQGFIIHAKGAPAGDRGRS